MLGSVDFEGQTVIADLEAGIGTLTRLEEGGVDVVVVVAEPSPRSLDVGVRAAALARQKTLGRVVVVASRVRGDDDLTRLRTAFPDVEIVPIPDDAAIVAAERAGVAPLDSAPDSPAVRALVAFAESVAPG